MKNFVKKFDYYCVPSKQLHDFCLVNFDIFKNPKLQYAASIVINAYHTGDECHCDYVRIIKRAI